MIGGRKCFLALAFAASYGIVDTGAEQRAANQIPSADREVFAEGKGVKSRNLRGRDDSNTSRRHDHRRYHFGANGRRGFWGRGYLMDQLAYQQDRRVHSRFRNHENSQNGNHENNRNSKTSRRLDRPKKTVEKTNLSRKTERVQRTPEVEKKNHNVRVEKTERTGNKLKRPASNLIDKIESTRPKKQNDVMKSKIKAEFEKLKVQAAKPIENHANPEPKNPFRRQLSVDISSYPGVDGIDRSEANYIDHFCYPMDEYPEGEEACFTHSPRVHMEFQIPLHIDCNTMAYTTGTQSEKDVQCLKDFEDELNAEIHTNSNALSMLLPMLNSADKLFKTDIDQQLNVAPERVVEDVNFKVTNFGETSASPTSLVDPPINVLGAPRKAEHQLTAQERFGNEMLNYENLDNLVIENLRAQLEGSRWGWTPWTGPESGAGVDYLLVDPTARSLEARARRSSLFEDGDEGQAAFSKMSSSSRKIMKTGQKRKYFDELDHKKRALLNMLNANKPVEEQVENVDHIFEDKKTESKKSKRSLEKDGGQKRKLSSRITFTTRRLRVMLTVKWIHLLPVHRGMIATDWLAFEDDRAIYEPTVIYGWLVPFYLGRMGQRGTGATDKISKDMEASGASTIFLRGQIAPAAGSAMRSKENPYLKYRIYEVGKLLENRSDNPFEPKFPYSYTSNPYDFEEDDSSLSSILGSGGDERFALQIDPAVVKVCGVDKRFAVVKICKSQNMWRFTPREDFDYGGNGGVDVLYNHYFAMVVQRVLGRYLGVDIVYPEGYGPGSTGSGGNSNYGSGGGYGNPYSGYFGYGMGYGYGYDSGGTSWDPPQIMQIEMLDAYLASTKPRCEDSSSKCTVNNVQMEMYNIVVPMAQLECFKSVFATPEACMDALTEAYRTKLMPNLYLDDFSNQDTLTFAEYLKIDVLNEFASYRERLFLNMDANQVLPLFDLLDFKPEGITFEYLSTFMEHEATTTGASSRRTTTGASSRRRRTTTTGGTRKMALDSSSHSDENEDSNESANQVRFHSRSNNEPTLALESDRDLQQEDAGDEDFLSSDSLSGEASWDVDFQVRIEFGIIRPDWLESDETTKEDIDYVMALDQYTVSASLVFLIRAINRDPQYLQALMPGEVLEGMLGPVTGTYVANLQGHFLLGNGVSNPNRQEAIDWTHLEYPITTSDSIVPSVAEIFALGRKETVVSLDLCTSWNFSYFDWSQGRWGLMYSELSFCPGRRELTNLPQKVSNRSNPAYMLSQTATKFQESKGGNSITQAALRHPAFAHLDFSYLDPVQTVNAKSYGSSSGSVRMGRDLLEHMRGIPHMKLKYAIALYGCDEEFDFGDIIMLSGGVPGEEIGALVSSDAGSNAQKDTFLDDARYRTFNLDGTCKAPYRLKNEVLESRRTMLESATTEDRMLSRTEGRTLSKNLESAASFGNPESATSLGTPESATEKGGIKEGATLEKALLEKSVSSKSTSTPYDELHRSLQTLPHTFPAGCLNDGQETEDLKSLEYPPSIATESTYEEITTNRKCSTYLPVMNLQWRFAMENFYCGFDDGAPTSCANLLNALFSGSTQALRQAAAFGMGAAATAESGSSSLELPDWRTEIDHFRQTNVPLSEIENAFKQAFWEANSAYFTSSNAKYNSDSAGNNLDAIPDLHAMNLIRNVTIKVGTKGSSGNDFGYADRRMSSERPMEANANPYEKATQKTIPFQDSLNESAASEKRRRKLQSSDPKLSKDNFWTLYFLVDFTVGIPEFLSPQDGSGKGAFELINLFQPEEAPGKFGKYVRTLTNVQETLRKRIQTWFDQNGYAVNKYGGATHNSTAGLAFISGPVVEASTTDGGLLSTSIGPIYQTACTMEGAATGGVLGAIVGSTAEIAASIQQLRLRFDFCSAHLNGLTFKGKVCPKSPGYDGNHEGFPTISSQMEKLLPLINDEAERQCLDINAYKMYTLSQQQDPFPDVGGPMYAVGDGSTSASGDGSNEDPEVAPNYVLHPLDPTGAGFTAGERKQCEGWKSSCDYQDVPVASVDWGFTLNNLACRRDALPPGSNAYTVISYCIQLLFDEIAIVGESGSSRVEELNPVQRLFASRAAWAFKSVRTKFPSSKEGSLIHQKILPLDMVMKTSGDDSAEAKEVAGSKAGKDGSATGADSVRGGTDSGAPEGTYEPEVAKSQRQGWPTSINPVYSIQFYIGVDAASLHGGSRARRLDPSDAASAFEQNWKAEIQKHIEQGELPALEMRDGKMRRLDGDDEHKKRATGENGKQRVMQEYGSSSSYNGEDIESACNEIYCALTNLPVTLRFYVAGGFPELIGSESDIDGCRDTGDYDFQNIVRDYILSVKTAAFDWLGSGQEPAKDLYGQFNAQGSASESTSGEDFETWTGFGVDALYGGGPTGDMSNASIGGMRGSSIQETYIGTPIDFIKFTSGAISDEQRRLSKGGDDERRLNPKNSNGNSKATMVKSIFMKMMRKDVEKFNRQFNEHIRELNSSAVHQKHVAKNHGAKKHGSKNNVIKHHSDGGEEEHGNSKKKHQKQDAHKDGVNKLLRESMEKDLQFTNQGRNLHSTDSNLSVDRRPLTDTSSILSTDRRSLLTGTSSIFTHIAGNGGLVKAEYDDGTKQRCLVQRFVQPDIGVQMPWHFCYHCDCPYYRGSRSSYGDQNDDIGAQYDNMGGMYGGYEGYETMAAGGGKDGGMDSGLDYYGYGYLETEYSGYGDGSIGNDYMGKQASHGTSISVGGRQGDSRKSHASRRLDRKLQLSSGDSATASSGDSAAAPSGVSATSSVGDAVVSSGGTPSQSAASAAGTASTETGTADSQAGTPISQAGTTGSTTGAEAGTSGSDSTTPTLSTTEEPVMLPPPQNWDSQCAATHPRAIENFGRWLIPPGSLFDDPRKPDSRKPTPRLSDVPLEDGAEVKMMEMEVGFKLNAVACTSSDRLKCEKDLTKMLNEDTKFKSDFAAQVASGMEGVDPNMVKNIIVVAKAVTRMLDAAQVSKKRSLQQTVNMDVKVNYDIQIPSTIEGNAVFSQLQTAGIVVGSTATPIVQSESLLKMVQDSAANSGMTDMVSSAAVGTVSTEVKKVKTITVGATTAAPGGASSGGGDSGMGTGALIGIIAGCCVVILGGGAYVMRKSQGRVVPDPNNGVVPQENTGYNDTHANKNDMGNGHNIEINEPPKAIELTQVEKLSVSKEPPGSQPVGEPVAQPKQAAEAEPVAQPAPQPEPAAAQPAATEAAAHHSTSQQQMAQPKTEAERLAWADWYAKTYPGYPNPYATSAPIQGQQAAAVVDPAQLAWAQSYVPPTSEQYAAMTPEQQQTTHYYAQIAQHILTVAAAATVESGGSPVAAAAPKPAAPTAAPAPGAPAHDMAANVLSS